MHKWRYREIQTTGVRLNNIVHYLKCLIDLNEYEMLGDRVQWLCLNCLNWFFFSSSTNDFCSFQGSSFVSLLPVVWIEQKPPLQVKPHIPVKPYHIVRSCSEAPRPFRPSQIFMSLQSHMTFSREIQNNMSKLVFPTQWWCMLI